MPRVQGVAEDSRDMIHVEVSTGADPFTLRHAVLVDGPFQLPKGFRLASDVVYLYSDPSQPFRPFILYLPHWYCQGEGQGEGQIEGEDWHGDTDREEERKRGVKTSLIFIKAPHTCSWAEGEGLYKFELLEGGNFHLPSTGSFLVSHHSTLFAIAYEESGASNLKYCATHLEREDAVGQQVDIAVTFATPTWQEVRLSVCLGMCK